MPARAGRQGRLLPAVLAAGRGRVESGRRPAPRSDIRARRASRRDARLPPAVLRPDETPSAPPRPGGTARAPGQHAPAAGGTARRRRPAHAVPGPPRPGPGVPGRLRRRQPLAGLGTAHRRKARRVPRLDKPGPHRHPPGPGNQPGLLRRGRHDPPLGDLPAAAGALHRHRARRRGPHRDGHLRRRPAASPGGLARTQAGLAASRRRPRRDRMGAGAARRDQPLGSPQSAHGEPVRRQPPARPGLMVTASRSPARGHPRRCPGLHPPPARAPAQRRSRHCAPSSASAPGTG